MNQHAVATASGLLFLRIRQNTADIFTSDVDIICVAQARLEVDDFAAEVREYYLERSSPALVVVIGLSTQSKAIHELLEAAETRRVLPARAIEHGPLDHALVVVFDKDGRPQVDPVDDGLLTQSTLINSIDALLDDAFTAGMRALFIAAETTLPASDNVHYKSPGGSHQGRFLRIGAAFPNRASAAFAALAIWRIVGVRDFTSVLIDSSTIASVGYALADLQRELTSAPQLANLEVFGGHSSDSAEILWRSPHSSVYLISASVSGQLHSKVEDVTDGDGRVVSVFYAGTEDPGPLRALVDVVRRGDTTEFGRIDAIPAYRPWACPMCDSGSTLVEIVSESLVPASPRTVPRKLTVADAPAWVQANGSHLFSARAWACNASDGGGPDDLKRATFADLKSAVEDKGFRERLRTWLKDLPVPNCVALVFPDEEGSRILASEWRSVRRGSPSLELSNQDLRQRPEPLPNGDVVVVCGAVSSGRALIEISRALRVQAPNAVIHYVIGIARPSDSSRWLSIQQDLTYSAGKSNVHKVHPMYEITLPSDRDVPRSAWEDELSVWSEILRPYDEAELTTPFGDDPPPEIQSVPNPEERAKEPAAGDQQHRYVLSDTLLEQVRQRAERLRNGEPLIDDVLLPMSESGLVWSADGRQAMQLSSGFAFWDLTKWVGFDYDRATQGDVCATMAAALNEARSRRVQRANGELADQLTQDAHNRVVIDPFAFNRYSDAVIQGALLRLARPAEVDYSSSYELSRDMATILSTIFRAIVTGDGAATSEFLLSLISGRLRIRPHDLEYALFELEKALAASGSLELIELLVAVCREKQLS